MKKKCKILISIFAAVGVLVAVGFFSYMKWFEEQPEIIEAHLGEGEYIAVELDDMMEHADLVVRGTYLGETDGRPQIVFGMPLSYGQLEVAQILKGSCDDILTFSYLGGEVNLRDVLNEMEKRESWPDSWFKSLKSSDPKNNRIYRAVDGPHIVHPKVGKEYLVFLVYNKTESYMLCSDVYSFREINEDGQVYNPITKNYDTIYNIPLE